MEKTLAKIILRAEEIADKSSDESQFSSCRRAAKLACEEFNMPKLEEPVYYLILHSWNDIQDWAKEQHE